MIKFVMCICRHPKLTRAEFQDYWLNKHGPFFQKNAADMRSRRYVQSHTLETPVNEGLRTSRNMLAEFDGVAEVWFADPEPRWIEIVTLRGDARYRGDEVAESEIVPEFRITADWLFA